MRCIYCGNKTEVINSRLQQRSNQTWRRRKCLHCQAVVTTIEAIDLSKSLMIQKPTGLEPFSRDKLLVSINDSLKHRRTAQTDASELTDTVIKLLPPVTEASLAVETVGEVIFTVLNRFDKAAASHFQAYHPTLNL